MKRLILTKLDPLPENGEAVYLGPWSLPESAHVNDSWEKYGFRLPLPRSAVPSAARAVEDISEHLLGEMTRLLNERHGAHLPRFWRILLMPWLIRLSMCAYDRFLRIRERARDGIPYEVFLTPEGEQISSEYTPHFNELLQQDAMNRLFFTRIVEALRPAHWTLLRGKPAPESQMQLSPFLWFLRKKLLVRKWLSVLASNLGYVQFFRVYGIGFLNGIVLSLRVALRRGIRMRGATPASCASPHNPRRVERSELARAIEEDGRLEPGDGERFLEVAEALARETLPRSLGKDFERYMRGADWMVRATTPWVRIVVSTDGLGADDQARFYIASMVERRGVAVVTSQHGGNYGLTDTFTLMGQTEYRTCDYFLSWGWKSHAGYSVPAIPVSSPLLSRVRRSQRCNGKAVLVTTEPVLYSKQLGSELFPEDVRKFRQDKVRFIQSLDMEIRACLLFRPYMSPIGLKYDAKYVTDRVGVLPILRGRMVKSYGGRFAPGLAGCRVCVIDHIGTTMAMTFAAGIPSVLFWDEDVWRVNDQGKQALEKLRSAGIFHSTPEGAARHLNAIWPDVRDWWDDARTREAVEFFSSRYCRSSRNWRAEWVQLLSSLQSPIFQELGLKASGSLREARPDRQRADEGVRKETERYDFLGFDRENRNS